MLYSLSIVVPPGPVMNLSAFAPEGSNSALIIRWLPPNSVPGGLLLYYNVSVTNYSRTPVTNVNVSDQTWTTVNGLG